MKVRTIKPMFTKLSICLVILTFSLDSFSQYYEVPLSEKVNSSTLIVEGKIISSSSFKSGDQIYTSHLLETYSELKGTVSCPTENNACIYLITLGGQVDDDILIWSHALKLREGQEGLFFLTPTNRPTNQSPNYSYEVYSGYQGFIEYQLDDEGDFQAKEIFHQYTDIESELFDQIFIEMGQSNPDFESFVRRKSGLLFYLHNPQVSSAFDTLEFDVSVKGLWSNSYPLVSTGFTIGYNNAFFGSSIVNGNRIFVDVTNPAAQAQYSTTVSDITDSTLFIQTDFTGSTNYLNVNGQFQQLYHVTLLISSLTGDPEIQVGFDPSTVSNSFQDTDQQTENGFEKISYKINKEGFPPDFLAEPEIMSIGPDYPDGTTYKFGAGVQRDFSYTIDNDPYAGEIIIRGSGFGEVDLTSNLSGKIPDDYRVEFKLFESVSNNFWSSPVQADYMKWEDDEIIVRIPSVAYQVEYSGNNVDITAPADEFFPQSGKVRVATPEGIAESTEEIYIGFNHRNSFFFNTANNFHSTSFRSLLKAPDGIDGYELYYSDEFNNKFGANGRDRFESALTEWKCRTLVNFEIKPFAEIANQANACKIHFGLVEACSGSDAALAFTPSNATVCTGATPQDREVKLDKFDIVFSDKDNINWFTLANENNILGSERDLETIALHELGHAHLLYHVIDENAIMFPTNDFAEVKRDLFEGEIVGGSHVTRASENDFFCPSPMIAYMPGGECVNNTQTAKLSPSLQFTPNPASNSISIEYPFISQGKFEFFDSSGKLLKVREVSGLSNLVIDISDFPKGLIFVKAHIDGNVFVSKLSKI